MASTIEISHENTSHAEPEYAGEKAASRSPSPPRRSASRSPPRVPSPPQSGENRLRPAGAIGQTDIINRINWDSKFSRDDYIIGFVDRFEGQLEVSMNSWKKETTDEEFIPQHRVLYIRHVNGEIKKPSLPRLATNVSSDRHSTTSLPALAPKIPAEINLHQRPKSERQAIAPFLFPEDDKEDENVAPVQHYFPETKPAYVISKSVEDESPTTTKKKTMYYEDAFAIRGSHNSPKDRVALDSVGDSRLISELVFRLAHIYQRPESALQVVVQHNVSVVFGNTSLPSYLLKIYALPSAIAPVTNIRNTDLIQKGLQELLGIAPDQGVVLFLSVPEENLATNGSTAQGTISRLERNEAESPGLIKSISRGMSRHLKSSSGNSAPISLSSPLTSPSSSTPTTLLQSPTAEAAPVEEGRRGRTLKKRESLRTIIHRHMRPKKESEPKENMKE
ncbi:uncharacterized protein N7496_012068 [Penicillium cataractarum]|uniref:L-dopachrome isomerase n=1 Tax=Penicillium cataractarum TaxID=2100454 RepID=A0A9W9RHI0_9EURO|nr:uncharacterized protein N7496_012068 [Penicillium cataractarum]KAJ5359655.1 hypothetical protein N7496_012068 [Penicillium cataractarum]